MSCLSSAGCSRPHSGCRKRGNRHTVRRRTHPQPSRPLVGRLLNLHPLQRHVVDGPFLDFLPPVLHRALETKQKEALKQRISDGGLSKSEFTRFYKNGGGKAEVLISWEKTGRDATVACKQTSKESPKCSETSKTRKAACPAFLSPHPCTPVTQLWVRAGRLGLELKDLLQRAPTTQMKTSVEFSPLPLFDYTRLSRPISKPSRKTKWTRAHLDPVCGCKSPPNKHAAKSETATLLNAQNKNGSGRTSAAGDVLTHLHMETQTKTEAEKRHQPNINTTHAGLQPTPLTHTSQPRLSVLSFARFKVTVHAIPPHRKGQGGKAWWHSAMFGGGGGVCDPWMKRKKKTKGNRGVDEGQQADENTNTPALVLLPRSASECHVFRFFLWKLAGTGADKYTSMTHALHTLPKQ